MTRRAMVRSSRKAPPKPVTAQKTYDPYANFNAYAYSHTSSYGLYGEGDLGLDDYSRALAYQTVGIVRRCDDLLAQAVSSLHWTIVRGKGRDAEEVASSEDVRPQHPAAQAILDVYARQGTALFELWSHSRNLYGETYIEKCINPYGGNKRIEWLDPYVTRPNTATGRIRDFYYGGINGMGQVTLPVESVAYDRTYNSLDRLRGLSKIDSALRDVNVITAFKRFIAFTLKNNARPGVIAAPRDVSGQATPTFLVEQQINLVQAILSDNHIGPTNAHRAVVLPSQMDITTLEGPELDKYRGLLEDFNKAVCLVYGVPMAMAGDSSSTTFKDGPEVRQAFYINTVIPQVRNHQDFFNIAVMPFLDPDGDCSLRFDTAEFEDSTASDRAMTDIVTIQQDKGLLTLADAQRAQGLAVYPEYEGMVMINGVIMALADVGKPTAVQPQFGYGQSELPMPDTSRLEIHQPEPQKGATSLCVMLSLANNPNLIDLQKRLKTMFPDPAVRWNEPSDFHITLLYVPSVDDAQVDEVVGVLPDISAAGMSLTVGSLACFDNIGEHALHFRLSRNSDLFDMQAELFATCDAMRLQVSGHSRPAQYTPHITMGYIPERISRLTFHGKISVQPLGVICSVERGGEDEIVYPLENDEQSALKAQFPARAEYSFETPLPVAQWREKALNELKAWQKHVKAGKTRQFEPVYLRGDLADTLSTLPVCETHIPDFDPQCLFDHAFAAVRSSAFDGTAAFLVRLINEGLPATDSIKAWADTKQEFEDEILLTIDDARSGTLAQPAFESLMKRLIRTLGEQAYIDGLSDSGVDDALDQGDRASIASLVSQQSGYVDALATQLYGAGITDLQFDRKAEMWVNKTLTPFYQAAQAAADANAMFEWRYGDTEHCADCLRLNGQRHRMKDWIREGWLPQSNGTKTLACQGYNCKCSLILVRGRSRGDF